MRIRTSVMVLAGLLATSGADAAEPAASALPGNPLGECFVLKSTGQDRLTLVRWVAAGLLASSKVGDLAQVAPEKRTAGSREVAAIFTRLITKDCLAEARAVTAGSDASTGMRAAGEALGRIAMQEMFADPGVASAMSDYVKYLRAEDFAALKPAK